MKNILFSTTRQFNIGDEFILFGILNIFDIILGKNNYNAIIFNRHPNIQMEIHGSAPFLTRKCAHKNFRGRGYLKKFLLMDFYDNSITTDSNWDNINMIVFAGTPEWQSLRTKILYQKAEKLDIPCIFIGIGAGDGFSEKWISKLEEKIFLKSKFISVRDEYVFDVLSKYGALMKPCPALLSSIHDKVREKVKKIGLIYSSSRVSRCNNISPETELFIKKLYDNIFEKYNAALICHYEEELDYVEEDFPNREYHYSYDASSYFDIYDEYDMVIGCRVHGIGIAASLGIPGIAINHNIRSSTVKLFGAKQIFTGSKNIKETLTIIEDMIENIKLYSQNIINIKNNTKQQYIESLSKILTNL